MQKKNHHNYWSVVRIENMQWKMIQVRGNENGHCRLVITLLNIREAKVDIMTLHLLSIFLLKL
jgi:hypothetical protein